MATSLKDLVVTLGYKVDESGAKRFEEGFKKMKESVLHVAEAVGAVEIGKQILETTGAWQQAQVAFAQMLGSGQTATAMMKELDEFSQKSPFSRDDIFNYSKQLLNFGYSAEEIMPIMQKLGDISAGVGTQAMPAIVEALSRIKSKGVADMRSLQSMTNSGIPIVQQLAKQYNVTNLQIMQMAQQGRIGYAAINQALTAMTTGMGKFAGMQEKMANTLPGLVKQIKGKFEEAALSIGNAFLPIIQRALGWFNKFWDANHEKVIVGLVKAFGYLAVTVAFVLGWIKRIYDQLEKSGAIDNFKKSLEGVGIAITNLTKTQGFHDFVNWLANLTGSGVSDALNIIKSTIEAISALLDLLGGKWGSAWGKIDDFNKTMVGVGNSLGNTLIPSVIQAANDLESWLEKKTGYDPTSGSFGGSSSTIHVNANINIGDAGAPSNLGAFDRRAQEIFDRHLRQAAAELAPQGAY